MKLSKYITLSLLLLFIGGALFSSCKKDENNETLTNNPSNPLVQDSILQVYFTENNITPQKTQSGLYYVLDEQGTTIQNGERVTVNYEGKLLSGAIFDSSFGRQPFTFTVGGGVIDGWNEGVPLIGKGGKGTLYLPSHLGYGARGAGSDIPPYAILVFRIEVFN